jgi:hypothetical protein
MLGLRIEEQTGLAFARGMPRVLGVPLEVIVKKVLICSEEERTAATGRINDT